MAEGYFQGEFAYGGMESARTDGSSLRGPGQVGRCGVDSLVLDAI